MDVDKLFFADETMAKEKKPGKQRRKGSDENDHSSRQTLLSSLSTTQQTIKKIVHNFCE